MASLAGHTDSRTKNVKGRADRLSWWPPCSKAEGKRTNFVREASKADSQENLPSLDQSPVETFAASWKIPEDSRAKGWRGLEGASGWTEASPDCSLRKVGCY